MHPAADLYQPFATHLRVEAGSSESTIRAYLGDIKRLRRWLDAETGKEGLPPTWVEVTERDIRTYLAYLATDRFVERPDGARVSVAPITPKTTHRIISSVRRWFDYLIDVEKLPIQPNPARRIRKPKLPKRQPPALTPEQVASLIATAHERSRSSERVRNWALMTFLYFTGLRVSELCNMRLRDIEYEGGWPVRLRVIGKGNKERTVVLSHAPAIGAGEAARALSVWLQHRAAIVSGLRGPASDHVWLVPVGARSGRPISAAGIRGIFRSLSRAVGLPVHPHILRHSFATHAVRRGARLDAVQRMLGHASLATTGMYLHASDEDLASVVRSLTELSR